MSTDRSVAGDLGVFPVLAGDVHLNHAGVAPLPRPVADAMRAYLDDWSWRGPQAWAYARIARLRDLAARLMGAAGADEIAIVPNTSTGLAIVAAGLGGAAGARGEDAPGAREGSGAISSVHPRGLGRGDVVVTTAVEFPANRYAWQDRVRDGLELVIVPASDGSGRFVRDDEIVATMHRAFGARPTAPSTGAGTKLLAISHVQFATGQRHDLPMLCAEARRLGALVCVDAIQSLGQTRFDAEGWGVDFASADGHKWMLGPEGAGVLYVRREHLDRLHPPLVGWLSTANPFDYDRYDPTLHPTAQRYEPGAFPMAGVVGLAAALEILLAEGVERIEPRIAELATRLADHARRAGCIVHSPQLDGAMALDATADARAGAGASGGSAAPCGGIVAIEPPAGIPPVTFEQRVRERGVHGVVRRGLFRLSPHFYNTIEQMDRAGSALAEAVAAG
ncbi:MAG: aminotransferase class V-fold PLP-dependent enzyme [Phycisphaerales bacterium]